MKIEVVNNCKGKEFKLEDGMVVRYADSFNAFNNATLLIQREGRIVEIDFDGKIFESRLSNYVLLKKIKDATDNYKIYKGKITIELTEEIKF